MNEDGAQDQVPLSSAKKSMSNTTSMDKKVAEKQRYKRIEGR